MQARPSELCPLTLGALPDCRGGGYTHEEVRDAGFGFFSNHNPYADDVDEPTSLVRSATRSAPL